MGADAEAVDCEPLDMPPGGCGVGLTLTKVVGVAVPLCWLSRPKVPTGAFGVPVDGLACEVFRVTGVTICARSMLDVDIEIVSRRWLWKKGNAWTCAGPLANGQNRWISLNCILFVSLRGQICGGSGDSGDLMSNKVVELGSPWQIYIQIF